jgi:hypothetical protein
MASASESKIRGCPDAKWSMMAANTSGLSTAQEGSSCGGRQQRSERWWWRLYHVFVCEWVFNNHERDTRQCYPINLLLVCLCVCVCVSAYYSPLSPARGASWVHGTGAPIKRESGCERKAPPSPFS